MCNIMKYPRLVSMTTPNSVVKWLEEELERKAIDGVYTRYILSLLLEDHLEPSECEHFKNPTRNTQLTCFVQQKQGRKPTLHYLTSEYEPCCSYKNQISKKEMALECLTSASDNLNTISELKSLIEMVYEKINSHAKLDHSCCNTDDPSNDLPTSFLTPPPSPQEETQEYFEAFPSLSQNQNKLPKMIEPKWGKSKMKVGEMPRYIESFEEGEGKIQATLNDKDQQMKHSFIVKELEPSNFCFNNGNNSFLDLLASPVKEDVSFALPKGHGITDSATKPSPFDSNCFSCSNNKISITLHNANNNEFSMKSTENKANEAKTEYKLPREFLGTDYKITNNIASLWGINMKPSQFIGDSIWKYEPAKANQAYQKRCFNDEIKPYMNKTIQSPIHRPSSNSLDQCPPKRGSHARDIVTDNTSLFAMNYNIHKSNNTASHGDSYYAQFLDESLHSSIWKPTPMATWKKDQKPLKEASKLPKQYDLFGSSSSIESLLNFASPNMSLSEEKGNMPLMYSKNEYDEDGFSRPNSCPIPKMTIPSAKVGSCRSAPNSYRETLEEALYEPNLKEDSNQFYEDSFFGYYQEELYDGEDSQYPMFSPNSQFLEEDNYPTTMRTMLSHEDFSAGTERKIREGFHRQVVTKKPCTFYLEGECFKPDCKFSHDLSTITCKFWESKSCFKGETCPFLHGYLPMKLEKDKKPIFKKPQFALESELDFPSLSSPSSSSFIIPPQKISSEPEIKIHRKKKKKKNLDKASSE